MSVDPGKLVASFRDDVDPTVTGLTLAVLALFVLFRAAFPETVSQDVLPGIRTWMLDVFGPLFTVLMVVFVLFAVVIIVGPWGNIRLGGEGTTPTYSYPAYFAMFFSAGIAAGIVFWTVGEPLFHLEGTPLSGGEGGDREAMQTTFFHWGISAWSAYVAVAIPIAYYAYNKGAPLRLATLLMPLIGKENVTHPAAKLVDVLGVFATIGGIAVSVGLVGPQFLSGVEFHWGTETTDIDTTIVIGGLTVIFTVSVITGVKRGIRRIAGVNLILFTVAGVAVLVLGPTQYIVTNGVWAFVDYILNFVQMTAATMTPGGEQEWFNTWTLFYWVWWFSWAPFAGLFLASISRGRTLRTVAGTGVFVAGLATLLWFAIVGNATLHTQTEGVADLLAIEGFAIEEVAGFAMFDAFPLGELLVFGLFALILTWLVTSADTSTLIIAILGTKPGIAPESATRAFWGILQGGMALGLILIGGADALQTAAVVTGGPIGVIALLGILGLGWSFYQETDEEDDDS